MSLKTVSVFVKSQRMYVARVRRNGAILTSNKQLAHRYRDPKVAVKWLREFGHDGIIIGRR